MVHFFLLELICGSCRYSRYFDPPPCRGTWTVVYECCAISNMAYSTGVAQQVPDRPVQDFSALLVYVVGSLGKESPLDIWDIQGLVWRIWQLARFKPVDVAECPKDGLRGLFSRYCQRLMKGAFPVIVRVF